MKRRAFFARVCGVLAGLPIIGPRLFAQTSHSHAALDNPHWIGNPHDYFIDDYVRDRSRLAVNRVLPWPDEPKATCKGKRHYDELLTGWHHGCRIEYCDPSPEFVGATFCYFEGPWRTKGAIWAPSIT